MNAEEARRQSLDNEFTYIERLIDQQITQGRLYLSLNYRISNVTKDQLVLEHYDVQILGGTPGRPVETQIQW